MEIEIVDLLFSFFIEKWMDVFPGVSDVFPQKLSRQEIHFAALQAKT